MEGGGGGETSQLPPRQKLFVGGVKKETTKLDLQKYFEQYGTVKDCFIVLKKLTRESRRCSFVEFEDPSSALKALQVHDHVILGKKVDVSFAKERKPNDESWESQQIRKIFIGGIPQTVTQQELKSFFEKFGIVTAAVLVQDKPTGTHRGFGFITFESKDSADAALNKKYHELNGSQVEVKRANPMVRNDHVRRCEFVDQTDLSCYAGYFPGYYDWNYHHYLQPPVWSYWWNNYYPYNYQFLAATNYYDSYQGWNWYDESYTTIYDYNNGMVGIPGYEQGAVWVNESEGKVEDHVPETMGVSYEGNDHTSKLADQQGSDGDTRIARCVIADYIEDENGTKKDVEVLNNCDKVDIDLFDMKNYLLDQEEVDEEAYGPKSHTKNQQIAGSSSGKKKSICCFKFGKWRR
ncbi:DAZ-associated protein 1 [Linum perenne]